MHIYVYKYASLIRKCWNHVKVREGFNFNVVFISTTSELRKALHMSGLLLLSYKYKLQP